MLNCRYNYLIWIEVRNWRFELALQFGNLNWCYNLAFELATHLILDKIGFGLANYYTRKNGFGLAKYLILGEIGFGLAEHFIRDKT